MNITKTLYLEYRHKSERMIALCNGRANNQIIQIVLSLTYCIMALDILSTEKW